MGFNPFLDTPRNKFLWVKLLRLPLEYWTQSDLMEIGNVVGKYVYMYPCILATQDKWVSWILVEVNYMVGLPENNDLE